MDKNTAGGCFCKAGGPFTNKEGGLLEKPQFQLVPMFLTFATLNFFFFFLL